MSCRLCATQPPFASPRVIHRCHRVRQGFVHINIDEGWLKGRSANGTIEEDRTKFPSGMKGLGSWIHNQVVPGKGKIMKYGLYTCRGTCQCNTQLYHGPGSHAHVAQDAAWLADAGADYLKEDSCCGSQVSSHVWVLRHAVFLDRPPLRHGTSLLATVGRAWFSEIYIHSLPTAACRTTRPRSAITPRCGTR